MQLSSSQGSQDLNHSHLLVAEVLEVSRCEAIVACDSPTVSPLHVLSALHHQLSLSLTHTHTHTHTHTESCMPHESPDSKGHLLYSGREILIFIPLGSLFTLHTIQPQKISEFILLNRNN